MADLQGRPCAFVQIRDPFRISYEVSQSSGETGRRMVANLELDGLYQLWAALLEERRTIVASVRTLRVTRRQKGTFVLGGGADAGSRFLAVQQQIDVVESVIARLTKDESEGTHPALGDATG
ncbi:hypothetical protein ACRAWG_25295 [Methylobacterium sp. P31]